MGIRQKSILEIREDDVRYLENGRIEIYIKDREEKK